MTDTIEQQLRKEVIELVLPHSFGFQGAKSYAPELADSITALFDTYAARRAGLGASEKPQPQEEVGGKQVDKRREIAE